MTFENAWKDIARKKWAEVAPDIERMMCSLWETPELSALEFVGSSLLADWLRQNQFEVEAPFCDIPTAFRACRKTGDGPTIAILAEYDALPGLSNEPVPYRKPTNQIAGHACGHNQIGAANCGAAIAALRTILELGIKGELIVIGCPAEEILWGKVALYKKGGFEGIDTILTSHGDYNNGVVSRPCLSAFSGEFVFRGEAAHGGLASNGNALDAAELTIQSIERLRGHHFPDVQVEHVIRLGGMAPNITPDQARIWFNVRHPNYERARKAYDFIVDVSKQTTRITGAEFQELFISSTRGYLPNDVIAQTMMTNLQIVGPPKWSDAALRWMKELAGNCASPGSFSIDDEINLISEGIDPYSQDDGEVSWRIPLGHVNWAYPRQVPLHNWAMTALTGYSGSNSGPLMASETLALTGVELMTRPDFVERAKNELLERTSNIRVSEPRLGAWCSLTSAPEGFWNGTWVENQ